MPTIIFTTPDGKQHDVSVDDGVTVMEAGRDANLGSRVPAVAACPVRRAMSLSIQIGLPKLVAPVRMRKICWIWLLALPRPRALDARSKCRMRLMGCV